MDDWLNGFFTLNPDATPIEPAVKTKAYKNDLFGDVLPALDRRDVKYYSKLSDEQKKDIAIWPLTRWMSSTASGSADQLYTVNAVVNKDSNIFGSKKSENALESNKHKELQWMLLAISGSGKREKHIWPGAPKGAVKSPLEEAILSLYPLMKDDDLELLLKINTRQELEDFFKENGYDDKSIKELFKGEAKGK
jgi:hypothetical protein